MGGNPLPLRVRTGTNFVYDTKYHIIKFKQFQMKGIL